MVVANERIGSCATCPVGKAAGVRFGGRCPFVDRRHAAGESLYLEGEAATKVWFIKRGAVILSRVHEPDGESPWTVRHPGAFLGLEALVQPSYRDTARIAADATLCAAPREEADTWMGPVGMPARVALEQVLSAECGDRVRAAGADGSAVRRVARWLLEPRAGDEGVLRRDAAGLLGMVPETLSRALSRLAHAGAVSVTRRTIAITDRQALEQMAH